VLAIILLLSACGQAENSNVVNEPTTTEPVTQTIEPTLDATPIQTVESTVEPTATPEPEKPLFELVTFFAEDGLMVNADLYMTEDTTAPYIILFHMADSSRGEYKSIAPQLMEIGYNCMAVDQRAGNSKIYVEAGISSGGGGIYNLTAVNLERMTNKMSYSEKNKKGLLPSYEFAYRDMKAALLYVRDELKAENIIIWGSSYSSSLVFVLGSEFPDDVKGLLSFSPGEYFSFGDKTFKDFAANVMCPVLVASEIEASEEIYHCVRFDIKEYHRVSAHGSPAANSIWESVVNFLNNLH